MFRFSSLLGVAFLLLTILICVGDLSKAAPPPDQSLAPAEQNWPYVTGDLANTRYSALTQVNTETVKNLGAAWISDKFDDAATSRVTPVVREGVMYLTAGAKVYALDARTGKIIWKYETSGSEIAMTGSAGGRGGRGIPSWQGVGLGEGKVFVGLTDGHMIALDEKSGKLLWNRLVGDDLTPVMTPKIDSSPVYVNGAVYTGLTFGEGRYVGRAIALDAKDGHELWRFNTVPGPGEPGHETWTGDPKSDFWKMGGGDVWLPPVFDLELGLVYYATGNPSPNRTRGDVRPGNDLYTCSVVALDIRTGKLRWYFQTTHHDLWEGDIATPLVLYDAKVGGTTRKALAAMRPDGTLFLLDRATGKPVWPVEERPVRQSSFYATSPTQPFPVGRASLIERDCSQFKPTLGFITRCEYFQPLSDDPPNILAYYCGTRASPMSYSPQTGYFYIQGNDRMVWEWNSPQPATWEFGSTGFMSPRVPNLWRQGAMIFAAVDPTTYKIVWRKQMRMPPTGRGGGGGAAIGGFLSTAGGLAFHRLEDGNLVAYDAKTGDELWKFQMGLIATDTQSPMSYEVDGQQYVAVIEDSQVWAFRLGGTLPQRPAPKLPDDFEVLVGPIQDSQVIRAAVPDEYNYKHDISPLKARVKVGSQVTFVNNGSDVHTFVADDGSWETDRLLPRQIAILTFDKPGTYLYHCKEHPWSYGMLIVTNASVSGSTQQPNGSALQESLKSLSVQGNRGRQTYDQQCSLCHQTDLSGTDMVPALAGSGFLLRWQGKTGKDLLDRIRTTMPPTAPLSLSEQTYVDLAAYLLEMNDVLRDLSVDTLAQTHLP